MDERRRQVAPGVSTTTAPARPENGPRFVRDSARRLASYSGFRWLLRIVLGVGILQVFLQWLVYPLLIVILPPHLYDFSYYYVAALALRENPHVDVYDPQVLPTVAQAHHLFYGAGQFGYPLLLPILLMPLTLLSFQAAARVWFFFNVLLWMVNTALLIDWLRHGLLSDSASSQAAPGASSILAPGEGFGGRWRFTHRALARWSNLSDASRFAVVVGLFVSLSYAPMMAAQLLGQASMLLLTCFLLAPWLVRRGHPEIAGFLLTLITLIKLFPAIVIVYYFLEGRWRVVLGAAVSFIMLLAGMALVVGIPGILSMRSLLSVVSTGSLGTYLNESLARIPMWIAIELGSQPGVATSLLGDALIAVIALTFLVGMVARALHRRRAADKRDAPYSPEVDARLAYGWALCTMLLVIPISQEHYDIWLLPAILFCLGYLVRQLGQLRHEPTDAVRREVVLTLAVLAALALTFSDLPLGYDGTLTLSLGPYIMGHPLRPLFMLLRPIGALLMWLVMGILLFRPRPRQRARAGGEAQGEGGSVLDIDRVAAVSMQNDAPWRLLAGTLLSLLGAIIVMRVIVQIVVSLAVVTPK